MELVSQLDLLHSVASVISSFDLKANLIVTVYNNYNKITPWL
jgi:hypothetical protein